MGKYLDFFREVLLGTWEILVQICPEMVEIQREIGVKQRGNTQFSACDGPNRQESIKLIDFESSLRTSPLTYYNPD